MVEIFVSANCPKCKILKSKLEEKGIEFVANSDLNEIIEKGFRAVPVLKVNDVYYDYIGGIRWINENATMLANN